MIVPLLALVVQAALAPTDSLTAALVAAEDGRARAPGQLETLVAALSHPDTAMQRRAVRALGRLERPDLLGAIAGALGGTAPSVRIAAAGAVAQAVSRGDGTPALGPLRARVAAETVPEVRAAVLAAVGRLRLAPGSAGAREVELILGDAVSSEGAHLDGALRGAWEFYRRQGRAAAAPVGVTNQLRRRADGASSPEGRRLALMTLLVVGGADSGHLSRGLRAADAELRRVAAGGLRTVADLPGRLELIRTALADPEARVRIEAVRGWTQHGRTSAGCDPLLAAVADPVPAVQLLAIEGLGHGCGPLRAPVELLDAIAAEPLAADAWHRPVRALQALALADSARAGLRLGRFASSGIWWVRMHAAPVAQRLGDRALLHRLAADAVDNVREAALRGLVALDGAGADSVALRQLARSDYQLILTAARALRNAALPADGFEAAWEALERLTREGKETSRDIRLALLDLVARDDPSRRQARLRPLLSDFDPLIAERAATLLTDAGSPARATPQHHSPTPLPSPAELRAATGTAIVMADGTRLELLLEPESAPANVSRFLAMARAGWFDGLTLHRVVPNFVLQGGSPGANEYVGGAEFTRDEVGGSHRRGTVGISTRGRDTGDGQLFLNLVDNLQLDHEYTVIGRVTSDHAALDRIVEGARIARVEWAAGRLSPGLDPVNKEPR